MTYDQLIELLKIFVPLVSAAGTAFIILWRRITKHIDERKVDLDECNRERKEMNTKVLDLTDRIGRLEGRIQGRTEGVLELAEAVVAATKENDGGTRG